MSTIVIGYIKKDGTCKCYSTGKGNIPACFTNSDFHVEGIKLIDLICKDFNSEVSDKAFFDGYGLVIYDERINTIYSAQEYTKIGQISASSVALSSSSDHKYSDIPNHLEKYYFADKVLLSAIKNQTVVCSRSLKQNPSFDFEPEVTFRFDNSVNPEDNLKAYLNYAKSRDHSSEYGFNFDIFTIENDVHLVTFDCNKEGYFQFSQKLHEIGCPIDEELVNDYLNNIEDF